MRNLIVIVLFTMMVSAFMSLPAMAETFTMSDSYSTVASLTTYDSSTYTELHIQDPNLIKIDMADPTKIVAQHMGLKIYGVAVDCVGFSTVRQNYKWQSALGGLANGFCFPPGTFSGASGPPAETEPSTHNGADVNINVEHHNSNISHRTKH